MTDSRTASPTIVKPSGLRHPDRRVGPASSAGRSRLRRPSASLSLVQAPVGAQRVLVLDGPLDLACAPRLGDLLEHAASDGGPLALDVRHAAALDADAMTLLVHAVRWVCQRHGDVTVVCPPGPVRSALEHSASPAGARLVSDGATLGAAASPSTTGNDPRPLVAPPAGARRPRAGTPGRRAALLAEATLALEARYADADLGLGDVARQIATSERQLQRVYAELAATAFRDELAGVRMQHGARLLRDTYMTVGEVARHVGYRNASQFTRAFRRFHGVTPTAFVRRLV